MARKQLRPGFVRLYHFLNAEYAIHNIEKQHIKISLLPDLNDPFELNTIPLPTIEHRSIWRRFIKDVSEKFGVICFSENWNSPVVWAHYAQKHYGICLGFDVPVALTKKVHYRKSLLPISLDTSLPSGGLGEKDMKKILYTKYSGWKYESEVRVQANLVNSEAHPEDSTKLIYFSNFGQDLELREVIVGARCLVSKAEIECALRDYQHKVKIIKARLAFNSFQVVPNQRGFIKYKQR